jgi:hypothetical protein
VTACIDNPIAGLVERGDEVDVCPLPCAPASNVFAKGFGET